MPSKTIWMDIGDLCRIFFTARFFGQRITSDLRKNLVCVAFFGGSLLGSIILLTFADWRCDSVVFLGFGTCLLILTRQILLLQPRPSEAEV